MKKKTIIELDYRELDELAQAVYGHDPEVVASEEWNNYESHQIDADGKLDKWDEQTLAKFIKTGECGFGIARVLLNDLVKGGKLEAGEYVIKIFW